MHVFKICRAQEWKIAQRDGVYIGSKMDRGYGYIHLCTEEQLPTMLSHYPDKGDLVLVEIDADKLHGALRYERTRDGAVYPHLYDMLTLDAVVKTGPPVRRADGKVAIKP